MQTPRIAHASRDKCEKKGFDLLVLLASFALIRLGVAPQYLKPSIVCQQAPMFKTILKK